MKPPSLNGGAVLGLIILAGCTGNVGLHLGEADREPIDWAQQNREEIENAEPEPEPDIEPVTHFAAGQLFEGKGNLPLAVLQYRKAIELKPDFVSAYNRLGVCLNKLRRFQEAEDCFSAAVHQSPDRAYLRNNLGFSLMLQKRWGEAVVHLQHAVAKSPEFKRARINLGMALAHQGREGDAMAQFERAVGTARAYYNLGLVYKTDGRVQDALRAFERALQLDPELHMVQEHLDELQARAATMPQAPNPPQHGLEPSPNAPRLAAAEAASAAVTWNDDPGLTAAAAPEPAAEAAPADPGTERVPLPLLLPQAEVPVEQHAGCEDPLARLEYMQVFPPCDSNSRVEQFGRDAQPSGLPASGGTLGSDLQAALDDTLLEWKSRGEVLGGPADIPQLLHQLREMLTDAWQQQHAQSRLSPPALDRTPSP